MDLVDVGKMTEEQAREYLESICWPDGPVCPHCDSKNATKMNGEAHRTGLYQCNSCRGQFTVTTGSIMEDSHVPLQKWVMAFHLMCSSKKGISALQLQRNLGLGSYKTAWFMAHRIRLAFRNDPIGPTLKGIVEVDETYVGGKPRPGTGKHKSGFGTKKAPVLVLVQRDGPSVVKPIPRVDSQNLKGTIEANVEKSAIIMTDELNRYRGLNKKFAGHEHVNHSIRQYAKLLKDGTVVHTNTAESYFALLKRGIMGAFHHVSKQHLHRYCDEFSFRWNNRKIEDGERTAEAVRKTRGKRLIYKEPA
jgi:transposase-like protein